MTQHKTCGAWEKGAGLSGRLLPGISAMAAGPRNQTAPADAYVKPSLDTLSPYGTPSLQTIVLPAPLQKLVCESSLVFAGNSAGDFAGILFGPTG